MTVLNLPRFYSEAEYEPIGKWLTGYFSDPKNIKIVWHTTQGYDSGLRSTYAASGGIPHFTIWSNGEISQHYPTDRYSRALRNLPGGVQTNLDGAIQVEIVGYAGTEHTGKQLNAITDLTQWFTDGGVSQTFPMGRLSKPYVRGTAEQWDNGIGHWAHGQVPENNHTDPDMTDDTWFALREGLDVTPTLIHEHFDPPHILEPIISELVPKDGKGILLLGLHGGVYNYGGAKFYGSASGKHYWLDDIDRRASHLSLRSDGLPGYTIWSENDEDYNY